MTAIGTAVRSHRARNETASPQPTERVTTFQSLHVRNFRLFTIGNGISMTGLWMQRIAQDWLVLTLTHSATAVGLTTALQCLPTLLLGVWGGSIADRLPKRKLLLATQVSMAVTASTLAAITLLGLVSVWQVYMFAVLLGVISVVDNPSRQSFVIELVGPGLLRNAISLSSSVFQLGALVGPATAGVIVGAVGPGYAFAINAASYLAPIVALAMMRDSEMMSRPRTGRAATNAGSELRRIVRQPYVLVPLLLVAVFGLFTPNLPVTLAASTASTFGGGPVLYGTFNAVVAIGSIVGALYASRQHRSTLRTLLTQGASVALCYLLAAAAPERVSFFLALFTVGIATLVFLTGTNAMVQMSTPSSHLGRVAGLYVLTILGSASIGGPLLGLVDQHVGPRFGLLLAALIPGATVAAVSWRITNRESHPEPTTQSSAFRNRAGSVHPFAPMVSVGRLITGRTRRGERARTAVQRRRFPGAGAPPSTEGRLRLRRRSSRRRVDDAVQPLGVRSP